MILYIRYGQSNTFFINKTLLDSILDDLLLVKQKEQDRLL